MRCGKIGHVLRALLHVYSPRHEKMSSPRGSPRSTAASPNRSPRRRTWISPASRLLRFSPTQGYRGLAPSAVQRSPTVHRGPAAPFVLQQGFLQPEQCPDNPFLDPPTDAPNHNLPKRTGETVTYNEYCIVAHVFSIISKAPPEVQQWMDGLGLRPRDQIQALTGLNKTACDVAINLRKQVFSRQETELDVAGRSRT